MTMTFLDANTKLCIRYSHAHQNEKQPHHAPHNSEGFRGTFKKRSENRLLLYDHVNQGDGQPFARGVQNSNPTL